MISASSVLRIGYLGIATLDTVLAGSRSPRAHRARRITKPLLMPTLAASLATERSRSELRTTTLVGEAAGWIGDVALLGDSPRDFAFGASSFAVGHTAYITGLLRSRDRSASALRPAMFAAGWLVGAPRTLIAAHRTQPSLALVLGTYSLLLTGTAAAASVAGPPLDARARRAALAGAGLFLVSDSLLGLRRFVLDQPPAWLEGAVMATYCGAQFLLADAAR